MFHHLHPIVLPSVPLSELNRLPNTPGIYYAINGWRVLYIGRATRSIRKRWQDHHQRHTLSIGTRIHYRVFHCPFLRVCRIQNAEAKAINRWKPPFNDRMERAIVWVLWVERVWLIVQCGAIGFVLGNIWRLANG